MKRKYSLKLAVVFVPVAIMLCWPGWWDNYHVVLPGEIYRSAQMSPPRLREHIARDGIRTVVNLRPETNELWHAQERQACQSAGADYIDYPLVGDRAPTPKEITALVATLRKARHPILIHCEHGADRTGFVVAIYLREIADQPEPEARAALSIRYGHLAFTFVRCFDDAFAQFCRDQHSPASP
jgi:uncharacterized protein (TIGR01244 family)